MKQTWNFHLLHRDWSRRRRLWPSRSTSTRRRSSLWSPSSWRWWEVCPTRTSSKPCSLMKRYYPCQSSDQRIIFFSARSHYSSLPTFSPTRKNSSTVETSSSLWWMRARNEQTTIFQCLSSWWSTGKCIFPASAFFRHVAGLAVDSLELLKD